MNGHRLAARYGGVIVGAALLAAGPCWSQADPPLAQALELYESGIWPAAFERLAALADARDPEAARISLMMVRHGPQLYKTRFEVAPERLHQWKQAVRERADAAPYSGEQAR